jgi:TolA-binding protein
MRSYLPIFLGSLAFVLMAGLIAVHGAFCLTAQDVPGADLPTANASPAISPAPSPNSRSSPSAAQAGPADSMTPESSPGAATQDDNGEEDYQSSDTGSENLETEQETSATPEPSPEAQSDDDTTGENTTGNDTGSADLETEQGTDTSQSPSPSPTAAPPPALDAAALAVGPELGSESLDPEINKAVAPSLAASLRLAESARKLLGDGQVDDAMRDLARAVSLDPSDAFAYYYLGRAYLAKKNYTQALTFFERAELGFNGRSDWTAEALSYQGLCDEELAKPIDAARAYKHALAVSPNNFKARIGSGRLASFSSGEENVDGPPPEQDLANPPPNTPDESVPPEQPPAPPPE